MSYISGPLPEQDAKAVAAGQANFMPKPPPQVLEYRVTDGATEYLLDQINGRGTAVANNIIKVLDTAAPKR